MRDPLRCRLGLHRYRWVTVGDPGHLWSRGLLCVGCGRARPGWYQ